MRLPKGLAFALLVTTLSACAAPTPPAPSPAKSSWHWEWTSGKGSGTAEQFARDRYACLQDYRQTASPFIQRDPVTELQMMNLHKEVCLEGKGWTKVQDGTPTPQKSGEAYWTPNGWQSAPAGT